MYLGCREETERDTAPRREARGRELPEAGRKVMAHAPQS